MLLLRQFLSELDDIYQLQLGTGKMAGWLSGCPGVWVSGCPVGWLVSHVCLSVRAMFGHISGTGRPINLVFGVLPKAVRPENVRRE